MLHRNNTKLSLMHAIIIISIESILFRCLPLERYNSGLRTISGSSSLAPGTGTNAHLKHFVSVLHCKLIYECLKWSVTSAPCAWCHSLCWIMHTRNLQEWQKSLQWVMVIIIIIIMHLVFVKHYYYYYYLVRNKYSKTAWSKDDGWIASLIQPSNFHS